MGTEQIADLGGHHDWTGGVVFSPDGATLFAADSDGAVRLWDVASRTLTAELTGLGANARSLAVSPDGTTIAAGGYLRDELVLLWDLGSQEPVARVDEGTSSGAPAFSPDGTVLATASNMDYRAKLRDVPS